MILVDAGPLVALVDASDQHHEACVRALKKIKEPLATVWPALTEAMYLLADLPRGQEAVWDMCERGAPRLLPLEEGDIPRIRELMRKYRDRPMDLADAALVRVAERERVRSVFTVDKKDFGVYRAYGRTRLTVIP
jgi:predicted nucleic acid-binding protein